MKRCHCGRSAEHCDSGRNGLCETHYKRGADEIRVYRTKVPKRRRDEILRRVYGCKCCTGCLRWLDVGTFRKSIATADGLASQCAECFVARSHGLESHRDYEALLSDQGGACAICRTIPRERLVIDHDRTCCPRRTSCGKCIRGLLCMKCNAGIGLLGDTAGDLLRAYNYLMAVELTPV